MGVIRGKIWINRTVVPKFVQIGAASYYLHGQPLFVQNLDELLVTGGGRTVYWDAVELEEVDDVTKLTKLTAAQKTYIDEYVSLD